MAFSSNPETLASNAFQSSEPDEHAGRRARDEFDGLVELLNSKRIGVHVFEGREEQDAPDEVFPNNWFSTHSDGTVVLYPMLAKNRRRERRLELLEQLDVRDGYRATRIIDLTFHEEREQYLEGTGSLVLDRPNRIAFASLSVRTQLDALGDFAQRLDYEVVTFEATDRANRPIYHTNVLLSVGSRFAVVCAEAIRGDAQRAAVLERLRDGGHDVIEIDLAQLECFAGNLLELEGEDGPIIALSTTAWDSLDSARRDRLAQYGEVIAAPIPTIEALGGGSVRCMLAEIFLPRR